MLREKNSILYKKHSLACRGYSNNLESIDRQFTIPEANKFSGNSSDTVGESLVVVRDHLKLANDYERTLNELKKLKEAYEKLKDELQEEKKKNIFAKRRKTQTDANIIDRSIERSVKHGFSIKHEVPLA